MSNSAPLQAALLRHRRTLVAVAVLSVVLNALTLAGSLYMMLVYDSVLPSRSVVTLAGLFVMVAVAYIFQGVFEAIRSRLLQIMAAAIDREVSPEIQRAMFEAKRRGIKIAGDGLAPMRDFDQVRGFLAGPGPGIVFDLPWVVVFLILLSVLHLWLGLAALAGGGAIVILALMTHLNTKVETDDSSRIAAFRYGMADTMLRHVDLVASLGMRARLADRWNRVNAAHGETQVRLAAVVAFYGGISRTSRMLLQSVILTVGAVLVIHGSATGGVIFASSMLSGRALAPIDLAIANWRGFAAARLGWRRVNELLRVVGERPPTMVALPYPNATLSVDGLVVTPPGSSRITVAGISFALQAGEALGIIGTSASGKSSLGRALVGAWPATRGTVRLDGATLDQFEMEALGAQIGYLPQTVELLDGTVAENIARFEVDPPEQAIIAAAKAAGVHELIVGLPNGYETDVGYGGERLSAGQRQRIGLARAVYRDPFLVVLDEPNSNLDVPGETALQEAVSTIRRRGGIVVLIAHRPSALSQVSHLMVVEQGRAQAFGLRDEILARGNAMTFAKPSAAPSPSRPYTATPNRKMQSWT